MDEAADDTYDLLDLTDLSLADVRKLDGTVFAHSLRRILEDIDRPNDVVAGWNSAM